MKEEQKLNSEIFRESKIPAIRTFKSDRSKYIKEKSVSLIGLASRQSKLGNTSKNTLYVKKYAVFLFVILILGAAVSGFAWFLFREKSSRQIQPPVPALSKPIIITEEKKEISVESGANKNEAQKIKSAVYLLLSETGGLKKLTSVSIVEKKGGAKKAVNAADFFSLLEMSPPNDFIQSLDGRFMLAVFQDGTGQTSPVLIFKIKSYEKAFAGMIEWEKKIFKDIGDVFIVNGDGGDNFFKDIELNNKDLRVLENDEKDVILVYSFINREFLAIGSSVSALEEIFRRFSLPRYLNL